MIDSKVEVIATELDDGDGKVIHIAVCYMPPQTRAWPNEEYEVLMTDTLKVIQSLFQERGRLILVGDFNCKEVCWETMDEGTNEETWGAKLMDLTTRYMVTQQVEETTRIRGGDEPSRLDLIFTMDPNEDDNIRYNCPLGKGDHVVIDFEMIIGRTQDGSELH